MFNCTGPLQAFITWPGYECSGDFCQFIQIVMIFSSLETYTRTHTHFNFETIEDKKMCIFFRQFRNKIKNDPLINVIAFLSQSTHILTNEQTNTHPHSRCAIKLFNDIIFRHNWKRIGTDSKSSAILSKHLNVNMSALFSPRWLPFSLPLIQSGYSVGK